jgi:starvation-inducible DNA-binding protein
MLKKNPDTGIETNVKTAMIELLNSRLADAIDLALITKQAHWNLKGPTFIAVHEFLDEVRDELDEHVDVIAERVAQLDGIALGTIQAVAGATTMPAYPTDIRKVDDHLKALVDHFARVSKSTREAIDAADDAGDADTADIFTAYSRALDKNLWFLKSHLE